MDNRAKGWKHAKISGHINEENIAKELGDGHYTKKTKVPSIFGDTTIPKRDLYGPTNPSIKKSKGGQVFLTPTHRFILGYEKLYRNDRLYDIVVILDYNFNPIIKNKGSAIFIHVAKKSFQETAGCIALNKKNLIDLLSVIKKNTKIKII